jgi:hypothetical protein
MLGLRLGLGGQRNLDNSQHRSFKKLISFDESFIMLGIVISCDQLLGCVWDC